MVSKQEKQLLQIIRYAPILFILSMSIIMTIFIYNENKKTFLNEKDKIKKDYYSVNKNNIKEEVNRVYDYINYMQKTTNEALRKQIKYRVYKAHEIATAIYNEYKTKLSQDEILKMIKVALGGVRYADGKGYFFMDDINGNKILHPVDTSIEGKNFLKYTDLRGYKLFEAIVQTIKDKTERFDEYYWYKPNTNKEVGKKVSFYKYFEPLNMAIGTGIYVDDFEKNVQKDVLNYLSMTKLSNNSDYIFVLEPLANSTIIN